MKWDWDGGMVDEGGRRGGEERGLHGGGGETSSRLSGRRCGGRGRSEVVGERERK